MILLINQTKNSRLEVKLEAVTKEEPFLALGTSKTEIAQLGKKMIQTSCLQKLRATKFTPLHLSLVALGAMVFMIEQNPVHFLRQVGGFLSMSHF